MTDDETKEVFVCRLTPEEYEALGEGETIRFEYPGAVIESGSLVDIEVAE